MASIRRAAHPSFVFPAAARSCAGRQVRPRDLNCHPSLPAINGKESEFLPLVNPARVITKGRWYNHELPHRVAWPLPGNTLFLPA
jgi:hypothetical protein